MSIAAYACDIRCMQLSLKIEQHSSGLFVVQLSLFLQAGILKFCIRSLPGVYGRCGGIAWAAQAAGLLWGGMVTTRSPGSMKMAQSGRVLKSQTTQPCLRPESATWLRERAEAR